MQEDSWSILCTYTLFESKFNYFPVPELMTWISGYSKLIATLITLPRLRAQKHTSYLNISLMVTCVLRNGWFSFTHTQFSSHPYSTHAVLSGYPCSLYSRVTRCYICYIHYIKLYMTAQILSHTPATTLYAHGTACPKTSALNLKNWGPCNGLVKTSAITHHSMLHMLYILTT